MFCIGLTGSVASGKSTVARLFQSKGIDIINADVIAKALVEPNKPAFKEIIEHFGRTILTDNGELNRRLLRELIMQNACDRAWLENCLHPLIRQQIEQDISQCKSPYCMIEIPLLTNKSAYPYLNRILLVTADTEKQITRLIARDNCSKEQALALFTTSHSHENKRHALADDYLINNGSMSELQEKVAKLHYDYIRRSITKPLMP